jgi:hypothetical protein
VMNRMKDLRPRWQSLRSGLMVRSVPGFLHGLVSLRPISGEGNLVAGQIAARTSFVEMS